VTSSSSWASERFDSLQMLPSSKQGSLLPVLVVDQPEAVADVDEVLGEQVVVARHRALVAQRERLADRADLRCELVIAGRQAEAALADEPPVARLDLEHVEVAEAATPRVQPAARVCDPVEAIAPAQVLGALRLPLDELEHEDRALGEVVDDVRADTRLGRADRGVVLVLAVDGEQARVLARHPHDVRAAADIDPVVRVREAARQRSDAALPARERGDQVEDLVDRARGHADLVPT
jgi:hypothetical protein